MPFIPHTETEIRSMLDTIGVNELEAIFDEIPDDLRCGQLEGVPEGLTEYEVTRLLHQRAAEDQALSCFAGAGAYDHHIPAAVWEITTRGEFYSAYTPYQAEASQGTLQLIYEYQSMMASLTGMDISNASLYDGASALAEAVLMAVRANRKSKSRKLLVAGTVNPTYRKVTNVIVHNQNISLDEVPFDNASGTTVTAALEAHAGEDYAALVIQQPNFFGSLEAVDEMTDWAHANGMLVVAVANPMTLAALKAPGQWGEKGADIACGEGQPLGVPMSSGGPYYGFMCCKQPLARQMPGRIVGRTVDLDGNPGFALTLQAREQHIRRSKATSNICTNQGLCVTASTIYMSLLGPEGLARVASASHKNMNALLAAIKDIDGVSVAHAGPSFHEALITLSKPAAVVIEQMANLGFLAGVSVSEDYPQYENALLVCTTETKNDADIAAYATALNTVLNGEAA
ncbi:MAG: aminomethyl-transferring glycine dehydrogenase subunit GcvPA [Gammaproteobacteria bacterium]|nr:aminomethyl-transferring glycine dehydrogenase subunit GcvPA [Gammaproteobacteria bacterium]